MPNEHSPGKPTKRRYGEEEKAAVVRTLRTLRNRAGQRARHGQVGRRATRVWSRGGAAAGSPVQGPRSPLRAHTTLRLTKCSPTGGGATHHSAGTAPPFDPPEATDRLQPVMHIRGPRWSRYDATSMGRGRRAACCHRMRWPARRAAEFGDYATAVTRRDGVAGLHYSPTASTGAIATGTGTGTATGARTEAGRRLRPELLGSLRSCRQ